MTTRTLTEIIDHLATVIEALTPAAAPTDRLFTLSASPNRPLRRWLPEAGGNDMFRRFDIDDDGDRIDLATWQPDAGLVEMPIVITVAYPAVPKLFGLDELADLKAVVRSDAAQIRNAVQAVGGIVGSGHLANFVGTSRLDDGDERFWFQDIPVSPQFYMAQ